MAEEGEEQEMKVMEAREFTVHVGLVDHHKDFDLHSDTISGRFWATEIISFIFKRSCSRHCMENNLEMEYGQRRVGSRVVVESSAMRLL